MIAARSYRIVVAGGLALVLGLLLARAALAGHFHLYSCTDPTTHAPPPSDGWIPTPGLVVKNENTCESSDSIEVYLNPAM
jgi:hypothetical protein